jgi:regulator of sirC expression with transglutaminase-like and TPR domain
MHKRPDILAAVACALLVSALAARAGEIAAAKSHAEAIAAVQESAKKDETELTYLSVVIAASRVVEPALDEKKIERQVQALADKVKAAVATAATARAKIAAINNVIYTESGFRSEREVDVSPLAGEGALKASLLHCVLERKQGICLGLSTLYLVLAERAGQPIYAAHAPYHIFCRMDDGADHFNIECTANGTIRSDEAIARRVGATAAARKGDLYFRRLTKKEVLSDQLNNLAYDLAIRKQGPAPLTWAQVVEIIDLAAKLQPQSHEVLDTAGLVHSQAGNPVRALAICDQAIALCKEFGAPPEVLPGYEKRKQAYEAAVRRSKAEKTGVGQ